jgi:hypothetical protein
MGEVSTIGLDIAKSVFQIHGVDAAGAVVVRKRITRAKLLECMSSEHFGQLAGQFKRVSGSSGLKVQAAIAC